MNELKNAYYNYREELKLLDKGYITEKELKEIETMLKGMFGDNVLDIFVRWSEKLQKVGQYR